MGQSLAAKDIDELFLAYEKAMANIGFDRVNLCFVTEHIEIEESARYGVAINFPDDLVSHYTENNYFESDPVVRRICRSQ